MEKEILSWLVSLDFVQFVNRKPLENLQILKDKLLWVLDWENSEVNASIINAQVQLISNRIDYLIKSEDDYLD